jgi:hypothetical protein
MGSPYISPKPTWLQAEYTPIIKNDSINSFWEEKVTMVISNTVFQRNNIDDRFFEYHIFHEKVYF